MTSFLLKIIGIITMSFDHIGNAILGHFSFLNLIGRIAFPIFAFQTVQGYIHTKNFKKHMIKLFVFALIAQIPFMLFLSTFSKNIMTLNIFFTLFLGLLSIFLYDKSKNIFLGILSVILISSFAEFINVDYGMYGILLIFLFYVFKEKKIYMCLSTILLIILEYIPNIFSNPNYTITYINCIVFSALSLVFICLYNKKEGPKAKYLFYAFYPLHLIILFLINYFIL